MAGRLTATVLDGSTVDISDISGDLDLGAPPSRFMVAGPPGTLQEYVCSDRAFGEWVANEINAKLDQEYSYSGGHLRVGSAIQTDPFSGTPSLTCIAVWEGMNFSVKTHLVSGDAGDFIALLDQFEIQELPSGVVMKPRSSDVAVRTDGSTAPSLAMIIPGWGIVGVRPMTAGMASNLPTWPGEEVRGGQMYALGEGRTSTIMIVGESCVVSIRPDPGATDVELVDGASSLEVQWQAN